MFPRRVILKRENSTGVAAPGFKEKYNGEGYVITWRVMVVTRDGGDGGDAGNCEGDHKEEDKMVCNGIIADTKHRLLHSEVWLWHFLCSLRILSARRCQWPDSLDYLGAHNHGTKPPVSRVVTLYKKSGLMTLHLDLRADIAAIQK